jgi:methylated-DNA-[protein]-cysteine S-methyltransferase
MDINIYSYEFPEPLGRIGIAGGGGRIIRVLFNASTDVLRDLDFRRIIGAKEPDIAGGGIAADVRETELTACAASRLAEYLEGRRAAFELPLANDGGAFASKVYDELLKIPAGRTKSYKDIAIACGSPKAYRAVGMANNKNPIPLFIPCHRVISADGGLIGYAGGLRLKQFLLDLERKYYAG